MKSTLIAVILTFALRYNSSAAATTYTITTNSTWTTVVGNTDCWTCTFNITPGVTFTMNYSGTCGTCTFNNGDMAITQNLTCQSCSFNTDTITMASKALNLQSSTTSFTNTVFTLSGTGSILSTAGISLTNSKFTFSGTSYLNNNGGTYNSNNSYLYFNGNSYFTSTSGPMNFQNNSGIVAGDGTLASGAYININTSSPVNIYDNSLIKVSNNNNYYFNYSAYNSVTNSKTYTTTSNNLNCGTGYPNACNAPYLYGCATLNNAGMSSCIILALTSPDLSAVVSGPGSVALSWPATQDIYKVHFVVQRSADRNNWQTIGTVSGNGNNLLNGSYQFNDPAALNGTNAYRLQIVDEDGEITYSKAITVTIVASAERISIYPNPITAQAINITTPSTASVLVKIFSLSGQLLFLTSLKGQTHYQVSLPSAVPRNNYIVAEVISNVKTQAFTLLNQ